MIENLEHNRQFVGLQSENSVGKKKVIVPFHVVKYCLREGGGASVEPGMTIFCVNNIYLIDGTPVVKANRITKYLLGRNRLIKGLQLGLAGVKKNELLRLIISAQYAYQEQKDIKLVPPKSKLIFEIDILNFERISPQKMSDSELYHEVYYYLDLSDRYLRKKDEENGLGCINTAYYFAKKIMHYKCHIQGKILLKWGNILCHQQKFQDALAVVYQIDKYDQNILQDCLRLHIKLLQGLQRKQQTERLVEGAYNQNPGNDQIRRLCVNYYKQTENWQKLKKLPGYNYKKDRFVEVKPQENSMFLNLLF